MSKKIKVTRPIEDKIFTIRGQKVMIDRDLAELIELIVNCDRLQNL